MARKDELGRAGEDRAAMHLAAHGLDIRDRNWRVPAGELDIVAVDGPTVVVVEVKTRSSDAFGDPLEAVGPDKRARLWRLARQWRHAHPDIARGRGCRLDVVGLTGPDPARARIDHVRDVPWR